MNSAPMPPRAVPTLTEVLGEAELAREPLAEPVVPATLDDTADSPREDAEALLVEEVAEAVPIEEPPPHEEPAPPELDLAALEARVTQQVLLDLQRQVDLMLEYRLREALAPALARVCDLLIRESRTELSATLRDVVARAVSQELARQRAR